MPRRTTICDHCQGVVDLVLDQVLETPLVRCLECRHCHVKLIRRKPASELAQVERKAA
jgi:hypothetical protein